MDRVNTLTQSQFDELDQNLDKDAKPFRLMANGQAVTIGTGTLCSKGSNIMYHPIYWHRPWKFINQVLAGYRANNPGIIFKITYHE